MKIGDTVWWFDQNCRVYPPAPPGSSTQFGRSPIWRKHWRAEEIVAETSRSFVTKGGTKLPKKGPVPRGWATSQTQIDREGWVQEHRNRIAQLVSVLEFSDLRKVAKVLDYKEMPNEDW
jgi:hypothetical protein